MLISTSRLSTLLLNNQKAKNYPTDCPSVLKDTWAVLFAKGEWYCFAVIFELRSSDIAFGSLWRIKYHWNRKISIPLPQREISLCAKSTEYHYIKITTRKRVLFSLLRVVLSYTVTSREFVCQIPFLLKVTVLREPVLFRMLFYLPWSICVHI